MGKEIRTTVIGGVVFLVPLIFILLILTRAYRFALEVAAPISHLFPIERFAGVALADILAILLITGICYAAGRLARSSAIAAQVAKLDAFLDRAVPTYLPTKRGFVDSIVNRSFEDDWRVVSVGDAGEKRFMGFEIERLKNGDVVVFQPLSPNPKSGFVWTVPPDHVEPVDISPRDLTARLQAHGIGIGETL